MKHTHTTVSGWGRYRPVAVEAHSPTNTAEIAVGGLPDSELIARGLGRSYGDAAQRTGGAVVMTTNCLDVEWLDRDAGRIRVAAGVSIGDLIDRFAPKGWFVPVTPGTRHVTIGGGIAADIHGKNHHLDGSLGDHVKSLRLRLADDTIVTVNPSDNPSLFWATIGGMGLTGIIIDAEIAMIKIPTTTVGVETQRFDSLAPLLDEMRASDERHAFSVAWVDLLCDARSVLTQGSFAPAHHVAGSAGRYRRPPIMNVALPRVPLPRLTHTPAVRAFNELWWRKAPRTLTTTFESITAFFHPLDAITDWNRVYGRRGFLQWQCVVPDDAVSTLTRLAERLAELPSYFTVLKRFGPANEGLLSFPIPGWTLAVDLPATPITLASLRSLDEIVSDCGGRIYLAKDARLDRDLFETMYPRLAEFKALLADVDPGRRFASDLSVRLGI